MAHFHEVLFRLGFGQGRCLTCLGGQRLTSSELVFLRLGCFSCNSVRLGVGLVSESNPISSRCAARAKSTGRPCRRWVPGGGVCDWHGGKARQVKVKREQRVAVAEARAAAAAEPAVIVRREAEEVLIDLLDDVTRILAQIKSELHGNIVSPALLSVAGEWMDRTARVAKVITDGDLQERLHRRLGWLAEDRGSQLVALMAATVKVAPLSARDKWAVWDSMYVGIQMIKDGQAPPRMWGEETADFAEHLQEAAARERDAEQEELQDYVLDSSDEPLLFSSGNGSGVW